MKYILQYDVATDDLLISDALEKKAFVIRGNRLRQGIEPKEIKDSLEFLTKVVEDDLC